MVTVDSLAAQTAVVQLAVAQAAMTVVVQAAGAAVKDVGRSEGMLVVEMLEADRVGDSVVDSAGAAAGMVEGPAEKEAATVCEHMDWHIIRRLLYNPADPWSRSRSQAGTSKAHRHSLLRRLRMYHRTVATVVAAV